MTLTPSTLLAQRWPSLTARGLVTIKPVERIKKAATYSRAYRSAYMRAQRNGWGWAWCSKQVKNLYEP